ncbi:hypothetical protein CVT24_010857 [Panaeolus cyanescens]|uniref:F-box domain-containing protein n=1 Tax=Panaeolus cyanescens TaxID=181874 RepID=A0A409YYG5_9AGAR|nr:hypothetical protein CVT24_010857 [Panaeolus cyanescens]
MSNSFPLNDAAQYIQLKKATILPYMSNNEYPPDNVISAAHDILPIYQSLYREKQKIVDALQLVINDLLWDMDDIQYEIDQCHQIASPIRRLPNEVLAEIFRHTLPAHRNPRTHPSDSPILLTLVCRKWREISLSMPYMWSKIHIIWPRKDRKVCSSRRRGSSRSIAPILLHTDIWPQVIDRWLEQSGNLPLSISLGIPVHASESDSLPNQLPHSLSLSVDRWESFDFCGSPSFISLFLTSINSQSTRAHTFPRLKSIRMSFPLAEPIRNAAHFESLKPLFHAPTLQRASFEGIGTMVNDAMRMHSWHSLSRLDIHDISCSLVLQILRYRRNTLEECAFYVTSYTMSDAQDEIVLPRLRVLMIKADMRCDMRMYGLIHAPLLRHFSYYPLLAVPLTLAWVTVAFGQQTPPPGPSSLHAFIRRSLALEQLTLKVPLPKSDNNKRVITAKDAFEILYSAPQITSLVLDNQEDPKSARSVLVDDLPAINAPDYDRQVGNVLLNALLDPRSFSSAITDPEQSIASAQPVPFLPNLTSFEIRGTSFHGNEASLLSPLVEFINARINPIQVHDDPSTIATLERVKLSMLRNITSNVPSKIDDSIIDHAESVCRTIGKDLILDISYLHDEKGTRDDESDITTCYDGSFYAMDIQTWPDF